MTPTVVVIDDDLAFLASLVALFATANYIVRAFGSAAEFLHEIENIPVACIVTDLRMPNMDGLALIKVLKAGSRPDLKVVVISGHANVLEAVLVMQAGASDFLVKPFSPTTLLKAVSHAIRVRDMTAAKDAFEANDR